MSSECIVWAMPISQCFLVDPPVDGVIDPFAAAERVSKLSLKNRSVYKRGLRKIDPTHKKQRQRKNQQQRRKRRLW